MALENYISPEGRLVQGSAFARQDKDKAGKPYKKDNGEAYTKGFIGVAFQKGLPEVEQMIAAIKGQGPIEVPACFVNGLLHPPTRKFSYKIIDGDGVDDDGLPNNTKEGFAGHWVIRMSTQFQIKVHPTGKYAPTEELFQQPGGPEPFGRGNYIRVIFTVKTNGSTDKPGLAIYPSNVEFMRAGTPITSGPSAAALFGAAGGGAAAGPVYIMQASAGGLTREQYHASGWSDAQLISAGHMSVQTPVAAPPPAAAVAAPPPAAPAAPAAPVAVAPHTGILTPQAAPAGPVYIMQASAGGLTREQYHASGWSDAQLISAGHMSVQTPVAAPPPAAAVAAPPPAAPAAPAAPLPPGGSAPMPPAPAPTAVATAAPGYKMADPAGPPYAAYIAQGWTDAGLVQNQIMVPA